jgi:hypothetical protein
VELLAEADPSGLALVETSGYDGAVSAHGAGGLVERAVVAAEFDRDVNAGTEGDPPDFAGQPGRGAERLAGAPVQCSLASGLNAVHSDHAGPVQHGEAGGQESNDALPEDGHRGAGAKVGGQDGTQGDGTDADEGTGQRIHTGRQYVAAQRLSRENAFVPVSPDAPHHITHAHRGISRRGSVGHRGLRLRGFVRRGAGPCGCRSHFHHFTDFRVPPRA